jgi:transcriptional regulator with XRE-family HTH domain
MTLRGLAAAAGISPAAVSKWESGTAQPRMPELDAVLAALNCSDALRREAYSRVNAPRALNRIKSLSAPPAGSPLFPPVAPPRIVWFPSSGDLLRCLRLRRGLTQERVALLLEVRTSTVSRWESGEMLLPERHRHACTALLATSVEEQRALKNVFLALTEEGSEGATSRDALDQRVEGLHRDVICGTSDLMDLRFLSLEAQLFKQPVAAWSQYLLLKTLTWHAQWLMWQDRDLEAGAMARRALSLMSRQEKPDPRCFRAAQIYASQLVRGHRATHPERGLKLLSKWLPQASWPHMEAWAHNIIANYYIDLGYREPALRFVQKANLAAERSENRASIRNSHYDSAIVLLKAGRVDDARSARYRAPAKRLPPPLRDVCSGQGNSSTGRPGERDRRHPADSPHDPGVQPPPELHGAPRVRFQPARRHSAARRNRPGFPPRAGGQYADRGLTRSAERPQCFSFSQPLRPVPMPVLRCAIVRRRSSSNNLGGV